MSERHPAASQSTPEKFGRLKLLREKAGQVLGKIGTSLADREQTFYRNTRERVDKLSESKTLERARGFYIRKKIAAKSMKDTFGREDDYMRARQDILREQAGGAPKLPESLEDVVLSYPERLSEEQQEELKGHRERVAAFYKKTIPELEEVIAENGGPVRPPAPELLEHERKSIMDGTDKIVIDGAELFGTHTRAGHKYDKLINTAATILPETKRERKLQEKINARKAKYDKTVAKVKNRDPRRTGLTKWAVERWDRLYTERKAEWAKEDISLLEKKLGKRRQGRETKHSNTVEFMNQLIQQRLDYLYEQKLRQAHAAYKQAEQKKLEETFGQLGLPYENTSMAYHTWVKSLGKEEKDKLYREAIIEHQDAIGRQFIHQERAETEKVEKAITINEGKENERTITKSIDISPWTIQGVNDYAAWALPWKEAGEMEAILAREKEKEEKAAAEEEAAKRLANETPPAQPPENGVPAASNSPRGGKLRRRIKGLAGKLRSRGRRANPS